MNAVRTNKSIEVINFLIEQGADITLKDGKGNTVAVDVLNAFSSRQPEIFKAKLKRLQKAGVDFSTTQAKGNTVLHLAVEKNNLQLLEHFINFKIDVNAKNKDGLTALHIAAMKAKDDGVLKFLLAHHADKTITTDFDETVYDLASENELLNTQNINFLK
jgi:ankyrin repeat protein